MTVWDVGGQERLRPLWRHYFQNSTAIIYVVDSNDPQRMEESSEELNALVYDITNSFFMYNEGNFKTFMRFSIFLFLENPAS